MWQTKVTGCGVSDALKELVGFSDRAHEALRYGTRYRHPRLDRVDQPMMTAVARLAAKAFYDEGSDVINHGTMVVGQLFVYTGPGLYLSFEPDESGHYWIISVAHINADGTVDDDLPVLEEIRGTSTYKWHQTPGPELDRDPLAVGRFGGNLLHE